jgi:hypothetical protein
MVRPHGQNDELYPHAGADPGGLPQQLVHQWKYGEGEGEEEVEKRIKMERERKKKRLALLPSCSASATAPVSFCANPLAVTTTFCYHVRFLNYYKGMSNGLARS